jgi:putative transposase
MYVQGVSTRKVITVLQAPLGPEVANSSSQVSRAAEQLDAGLASWRERPLGETPYVLPDVCYERVREAGRFVNCAVLVSIGITADGKRRDPDVSVAQPVAKGAEAEVHWRALLDCLIACGLCGVKLTVSDDHAGLKATRRATLPGAPGSAASFICSRMREAHALRVDQRKAAALRIKAIFNVPDVIEAECLLRQAIDIWAKEIPKRPAWTEENLPMGFTVCDLPAARRTRQRTTNGCPTGLTPPASTAHSKDEPASHPSSETPIPACASSPPSSPHATRNG